MGSIKSAERKAALGAALSKNRRVPLFVVAKTKRRVRENPHQRNWRKKKLKLHVK